PPDRHRDRVGKQFHDDLPDPARPVPGIPRLGRPAGRRPAASAHRQGLGGAASRAAGEDQDRGVAMAGELISREALERIIQRAAELQAGEHDIGDGLTETELLSLGQDVGIPARHLRQALLEERTRSLVPKPRGLIAWVGGPERLLGQRVVPGDARDVERSLGAWMEQYELLQMKRRYPDRISWDPKVGAFASIQRALGAGGRRFALARAAEVTGLVTPLETGFCHVQLLADVSNLRRQRLGIAGALFGLGAGTTGTFLAMAVLTPFAW